MTTVDRALPRRTATLEAETVIELDIERVDEFDDPRRRRPIALRALGAVAFVALALTGGVVVGGGFGARTERADGPTSTSTAPAGDRAAEVLPGGAPGRAARATIAVNPFAAGGRASGDVVDSEPEPETVPEDTTTAPEAPSSSVAPTSAAAAVAPTTLPERARLALAAPTTSTTVKLPTTTAKPTTTTAAPVPTTTAAIGSNDAAILACIRRRESGGNYSIVSANGLYYGAYQFTLSTWDSTARHAGRGDLVGRKPNTVAPADQDALALDLLHWQGLGPWGGHCP